MATVLFASLASCFALGNIVHTNMLMNRASACPTSGWCCEVSGSVPIFIATYENDPSYNDDVICPVQPPETMPPSFCYTMIHQFARRHDYVFDVFWLTELLLRFLSAPKMRNFLTNDRVIMEIATTTPFFVNNLFGLEKCYSFFYVFLFMRFALRLLKFLHYFPNWWLLR